MEQQIGKIGWLDLTVDDADSIRQFYEAVTGWQSSAFSLGDYDDYCVNPPGSENPVAGICHKRGDNANMPSQWMMYVTVADLDSSMQACEEMGGQILVRDRDMGSYGRLSVIQDPAGAVCGLMQPPSAS